MRARRAPSPLSSPAQAYVTVTAAAEDRDLPERQARIAQARDAAPATSNCTSRQCPSGAALCAGSQRTEGKFHVSAMRNARIAVWLSATEQTFDREFHAVSMPHDLSAEATNATPQEVRHQAAV
jgi:hypothetical protein